MTKRLRIIRARQRAADRSAAAMPKLYVSSSGQVGTTYHDVGGGAAAVFDAIYRAASGEPSAPPLKTT